MVSMTGCDLFPTIDVTVSRSHISQDKKEKALANKKNWNNNKIDYIPTPTPTPTPIPTPTQKKATVTCTNKTYPSSVKKGKSFNICGLISTDIGTIDKVTGCFIAKDGTVVTKASDKPKSNTYEIKRSIVDRRLAFGDLKSGDYICVIKAEGSDFDEIEVMRFNFKISSKTVTATVLVPTEAPTVGPTAPLKQTSSTTSTKKSDSTKASIKPLSETEKAIADRVVNADYPKNCKIVASYKKSNDSGYEYYKIISKYDKKSVSVIQEYEDESSELEAIDYYITTDKNTVKKFEYVDKYGWRSETINKAYLTPTGNKTVVSINLSNYLDDTTGGEWFVKATSSEYIVNCTGIKNKSNSNISKDITITTDKNYEIKSVSINIQNTNSIFKGEKGYRTDISIEVLDKNKTEVTVPDEVIADTFEM